MKFDIIYHYGTFKHLLLRGAKYKFLLILLTNSQNQKLQETKKIQKGNLGLFDFDTKTWKDAVIKWGGFNEEVLTQFQQLQITG